jgi:hypothetical protein
MGHIGLSHTISFRPLTIFFCTGGRNFEKHVGDAFTAFKDDFFSL